jgi:hypothetical protein
MGLLDLIIKGGLGLSKEKEEDETIIEVAKRKAEEFAKQLAAQAAKQNGKTSGLSGKDATEEEVGPVQGPVQQTEKEKKSQLVQTLIASMRKSRDERKSRANEELTKFSAKPTPGPITKVPKEAFLGSLSAKESQAGEARREQYLAEEAVKNSGFFSSFTELFEPSSKKDAIPVGVITPGQEEAAGIFGSPEDQFDVFNKAPSRLLAAIYRGYETIKGPDVDTPLPPGEAATSQAVPAQVSAPGSVEAASVVQLFRKGFVETLGENPKPASRDEEITEAIEVVSPTLLELPLWFGAEMIAVAKKTKKIATKMGDIATDFVKYEDALVPGPEVKLGAQELTSGNKLGATSNGKKAAQAIISNNSKGNELAAAIRDGITVKVKRNWVVWAKKWFGFNAKPNKEVKIFLAEVNKIDTTTAPEKVIDDLVDKALDLFRPLDRGPSISDSKLIGLAGAPGPKGLPNTSLATPKGEQFETYKAQAADIKFTGPDDMKLIQDRITGEVIGVQNTDGDTSMFSLEGEGAIKTSAAELETDLQKTYTDAGQDAEFPGTAKADVVLSEIFTEMDISVAGTRIQDPVTGDFSGVDSTFPSWIPEDLRRMDLFKKVMDGLVDVGKISYPTGNRSRQRALYDAILSELDSRLGVDTESIRNNITNLYEQRAITKSVDSSITGGEEVTGAKPSTPATRAKASVGKAEKQLEAFPKEDVEKSYENLKDVWIGGKDVKTFQAANEKKALQQEVLTAMGQKKYTPKVKNTDRAIQIYLDAKRNPGHIEEFYGDLTPEQQKLVDLSQSLPDKIKKIADKIADSYKEVGLEALDAGVIKNVLDNYVARIWNLDKKSGGKGKKFGTSTGHAKQRTLDTIIEGWAKGYDLKVGGATGSLETLKVEISNTIKDKAFLEDLKRLKTLDGDPLVTTQQLEGYVAIEHPNFKIWKWAGTAKGGKSYGKNFFVTEDGNLMERGSLFAPKGVAKNLNNILGTSKLNNVPGIKTITKYNAIIKSWVLQTSLFHHMAFARSYYLGTNHKRFSEMSIRQAYKQGLRSIEEEGEVIMLGVKNGLTLGIKQDWNEELLQEKTIIGEILDKTKASKWIKDKIMDLRDRQTGFLFGEMGAGLKAKSFEIEYRNLTKKHPEMDVNERAKMAANLINDDFGGLHLQRIGRNPTLQHVFRLFALAPDWTESNIRSMVKAIGAGEKAERSMYRKFWAGILTKGALLTVLGNVLMAGGDLKEVKENYKTAWDQGRLSLKWMDVDITNLYKLFGGDTKEHKYFSIFGHFKDPIKFTTNPIKSAQHKGSIVYSILHEALAGVDWSGRKFTNLKELIESGETVKFGSPGSISWEQVPSYLLNQLKGSQPVQIQNLLSWQAGEMAGFDAIANSLGLGVSSTYDLSKGQVESPELKEEFERLEETGNKATPTFFANEKKYDYLTDDDRKDLIEDSRIMLEDKLTKLMNDSWYKTASDEDRAKTIKNYTNQVRVRTRAEMIEKITKGLTEAEFNKEMAGLRDSGIMTGQVYDKWVEITDRY